jgi:ADP-ribose pyrophosphatase YjhB (NUDIX family)
MPDRHNPLDTVDAIIQKGDSIVLIRRNNEPFKGQLAFPGGFVGNETVEEAAVREAREETGLEVKLIGILGVYSDPSRDPRGHNISTVFVAEPAGGDLKASDDAQDAKWFNLEEISQDDMSFDHSKILRDYLEWRKTKRTYWSGKS